MLSIIVPNDCTYRYLISICWQFRCRAYQSSLYNYYDDNTLSYAHSNSDTLIHTLQQHCTSTLQWFNINQMTANPSKFQAISFGKRGIRDRKHFTFENTTIHCENSVVLLGIEIDNSKTFNTRIANIWKKFRREHFDLFTMIIHPRTF